MKMGLSAFKRALWVFHVSTGSCNGCDIEILAALTPRYDVERFGIRLVGTPRHADVLLVTGAVTRMMAERLKRIYEQTPDPKAVVVVGRLRLHLRRLLRELQLSGPGGPDYPRGCVRSRLPAQAGGHHRWRG
jgi:Ni,Fe-hydrogenase III small subunit